MAGYIGSRASVVSSGAERKKTFAITTTTTALTGLVYTPTKVHVFHNGVRLVDGTDFTATNSTSITLTVAAESGDQVVVVSYASFQTSDTVSASAGGTFQGNVTVAGAFTSQGIDDNATSTAMTLDSSGNVGIGTTSPSSYYSKDLVIAAPDEGGVTIVSGTTNTAYLMFADGTTGADRYRGQLAYDHNVNEMSFATDGSEAMRIDSSGTVGIGCVPNSIQSGFDTLQIGGNLTLNVDSTGAGAGVYMGNNVYRDSTNSRWEYINTDEASQYYQANGTHVWRYAASGSANAAISWSEAMRIDSSGNLLLGTTGTNWATTAGLYAFNQSALNVTRSGAESMNLNRLSSAGDIIKLYKSGSAVGSIGAFGNSGVYIAAPTSGGSALVFNGNAPILYPAKNNSGTIAVADNAIDLGASGVRFKDLYLSGGVYLGGTGAANKLDDYEEGTWTPTFENGTFTYNVQNGTYTKVGNLVTIACNIGWTSRSGSGALIIQTLPFTPINSGNTYRGAGSLGTISGVNKPSNHQMTVGVDAALAKIFLRYFADNSSWVGTNVGDLSASGEIQITVSYHAQ